MPISQPVFPVRTDDLISHVGAYTDAHGADVDTSDATMDDAVAINVPSRKARRVPIADKAVYDLREFYAGTAQPSDVIGHIHDGLEKTRVAGGSLLIPDSVEPWMVTSPIIPPPNSRMHGPESSARFHERYSNAHDGTKGYTLPSLPNAIGEAWIKLANGSNCPILMNDFDNSHSKRGPDRGNGAYWQWFNASRIRFDHNGRNQTMSTLGAIYFEDAWGMELIQCGLVAPRYRGVVLSNCNSCNMEKLSVAGDQEQIADGVGVANGTTTVTGATGTWTIGDFIFASGGGVTILSGTYLTNVTGSAGNLTLTLSATATGSGSVTLNHTVYISDHHLVLEDSTVDTEIYGVSAHAAKLSTLLLDSAYGCRVSGLFGYTIGGHNVWLRNTWTASSHYVGGCMNNYVAGRCDQATKHNVRIDTGCINNEIDVVGFGCGAFNTPNDADGGWATVFCDGKSNALYGTGDKSTTAAANMSAVVAYGPNAENNLGYMSGGVQTAGMHLYNYRPTVPATPGAIRTNTKPGPTSFFLPARSLERVTSDLRGVHRAVTAVAATDLLTTTTAHKFAADQQIVFQETTGGAGVTAGSPYYVIASGLTATDFKISTTIGGSAVDITSDMTAGTVMRPVLDYFGSSGHKVSSFLDGVTETVVGYFVVPYGTRRVRARAQVVNLNTAATGTAVRLYCGFADIYEGGGNTMGADEQSNGPITVTLNAAAQNTQLSSDFNTVGGAVAAVRFQRLGGDGADSLAGPLGLIGIEIEPLLVTS